MTPLATIPQAILDTILNRLAPLFLFGAAGDVAAAHQAAREMLAAYRPETLDELTLAAEVTSLSMHSLEALGSASERDLPPNKILRLRASAISLIREKNKALRKLDQLQRARGAGARIVVSKKQAEPVPGHEETENAVAAAQTENGVAIAQTENAVAAQTEPVNAPAQFPSSRPNHKLEAAQRIVANFKKRQAEYLSQAPAVAGGVQQAMPDPASTGPLPTT